jgi:serine/threonine protein kinase
MILTSQGPIHPFPFCSFSFRSTHSGHLKFVDFGTCKDLISTDLNGQEFVGTAEYMSPEVVESKPSGPETDLWSLGVVIYQMMVGYTPFLASSPYLSFLRIKRGFLRLPSFLDDATAEIISLLIHKDQKERFRNAAEKAPATTPAATDDDTAAKPKPSFSYDKLRNLAFFKQDPNFVFPNPFAEDPDSPAAAAVRVPTLSEIALRAVGQACLVVAEKIAVNGGSRVGLDQWIQVTSLPALLLPVPALC